MNHDSKEIRLAVGIENSMDQLRRLVGSQFSLSSATNITIMNSLIPTPPAICYNAGDNLYYFRHRGNFAGTLDLNFAGVEDPNLKGVVQNRDADSWVPLSFEKWLYSVKNKTELDQLIVAPPAIAFRRDNHRYYYRVGPEGYGGRTGQKQRLDPNGNPLWDSGPTITADVYVPGPNTWNTLYTDIVSTHVVAGTLFQVAGVIDPDTLLPITFQITEITTGQWRYLPEYDSETMIGKKITTQTTPPITGDVKPTPTPDITDNCYVLNLTGIVLVSHVFWVTVSEDTPRLGPYTITEIDESRWYYTPEAEQFPNFAKIEMDHAGNPQMEYRDPDAWILNSHLYEDNTQGFI